MPVPFIIDQAVTYSDVFTTPPDPLLQMILDETRAKHPKAHMLSGEVQGQFLSMLSCMKKPMHILEIGTFTGYSALCLAKGLAPSGLLHTIESRLEDAQTAKNYFEQSNYANQIELHIGDAKEIIPSLPNVFDLVFIDADKSNYCNYFNLVIGKMKIGGIILSVNVLWSGKVVEKLDKKDIDTKALLEYNRLLNSDPRVETVLLPIRDGLSISRVV